MPPRQQVPYSRNSFGRQPFPPMNGMRGQGPSHFGMMGQPRPMQGNFQMGAPRKSGGGLLSKILNRGNSAQSSPSQFNPLQGAAGFQRSSQAGGSFLKNIMNPGSINGFLNNTQNVLKTAQQMGPMIQQFQQYGPLVKNLPAMWKLYRGLSAAESDEDEDEDASTDSTVDDVEEELSEAKSVTKRSKKKKQTSSPDNSKKKRTQSGGSKPKLYV
jgi:hypothetical protein